jgi:hypothetical protein
MVPGAQKPHPHHARKRFTFRKQAFFVKIRPILVDLSYFLAFLTRFYALLPCP